MSALETIRILELGAIGPVPLCCMLLADMGADVVRIDRTQRPDLGSPGDPKVDMINRSKRSVAIDLRSPAGIRTALRMIEQVDVLVEGFRPGVTERLGIGPDECLALNPRLVYGRMTGWGRTGPLAQAVGHDINYLALAGALAVIGPPERPAVPLNMVADFGGGALFLALGITAALVERERSGKGQVVDAAMIDGVSTLMTSLYTALANGNWREGRGANMLDGGSPFYTVYETLDGKHVSIGAVEERFYRTLLEKTGLDGEALPAQFDRDGWPLLKERLAGIFRSKTRDEWCTLLDGSEVCFAPVLTPVEAKDHPQLRERGTMVVKDGVLQPAPSPRFSRTPSRIRSAPALPGQHTDAVLAEFGFDAAEVARLREGRVVA